MNMQTVLAELRAHLHVPSNKRNCDFWLIPFLEASGGSNKQAEAQQRLEVRRAFERTVLPTISVSERLVASLRSGAFSMLGEDRDGRPILYITAAGNKLHEWLSALDRENLQISHQRLAILLLEYLSYIVHQKNNLLASDNGENNERNTDLLQKRRRCLVVINENSANFFEAKQIVQFQQSLSTLINKYYVGLIGGVMIVNSSWATKRVIRMQLAAGSVLNSEGFIEFVSVAQIAKIIPTKALPVELGGKQDLSKYASYSSEWLCDEVLRHFYRLTTLAKTPVLMDHLALWESIWTLMDEQNQVSGARRSASSPHVKSGHTLTTNHSSPSAAVFERSAGELTDMVSVVSFSEAQQYMPSEIEPVESPTGDVRTLQLQLKAERTRRLELEKKIDQMELGLKPDSVAKKDVEAKLSKHHHEVNVLVANIIALAHQSGRKWTASEYLSMTDRTLQSVLQQIEPSPIMKMAQPINETAVKNVDSTVPDDSDATNEADNGGSCVLQ